MNHSREHLIEQMQEVVLLPHEDPARQAVLDAIIDAGPWAEQYWLDLVGEDERMRLDLRRVQTPVGMTDRLGAIPADEPLRRKGVWPLRAALAAALFALFAVVWWNVTVVPGPVDRLVGLVANHRHGHGHDLAVNRSIAIHIAQADLEDRLPFGVDLSLMPRGFRLVGYSVCPLGPASVACTRWLNDGRVYTLLQFDPREYDLPADSQTMSRHAQKANADGRIRVWTADDLGFALVADGALPQELSEIG